MPWVCFLRAELFHLAPIQIPRGKPAAPESGRRGPCRGRRHIWRAALHAIGRDISALWSDRIAEPLRELVTRRPPAPFNWPGPGH